MHQRIEVTRKITASKIGGTGRNRESQLAIAEGQEQKPLGNQWQGRKMSAIVDQLLEAPCPQIWELESRGAWSLGDPHTFMYFPSKSPTTFSQWRRKKPLCFSRRRERSHFEIHPEHSLLLNKICPQDEVLYQSLIHWGFTRTNSSSL